jgi:hypothetical protein
LGPRVWRHFRKIGKTGPSRIDAYTANDEIIASHDIEDEVLDDSGEARWSLESAREAFGNGHLEVLTFGNDLSEP